MNGSEVGPDGRIIAPSLREAHGSMGGERARILAAGPTSLASLAALRGRCRVEEVIRTRALHVGPGLEDG